MPQFVFSTAMTANQLGLNPLSGWQYEYVPYPATVILLVRSTTAGNRQTIFSGSETIQERVPVQAGGTAGVTPSELNTPAVSFQAEIGRAHSELQSRVDLVCRLLLEKKKKKHRNEDNK